ncbi:Cys-every-fifth RiPP peptide CefA [Sorangium sp. So ce1153]|uniref:Cys-every-fifth RiPP peptide CefA n=1 Tax=Sorangium sp. So ce1153 TaxID=3133333 RepID=UPI003F6361D2
MRYIVQPLTGNSMNHPSYSFNHSKRYSLALGESGLAITAGELNLPDQYHERVTGLHHSMWVAALDQQWQFEPVDDGAWFRIVSVATGKVVEPLTFLQGTALVLADKLPDASKQMWKLVYLGGSRFRIQPRDGHGEWNSYDSLIMLGSGGAGVQFSEILDMDATSGGSSYPVDPSKRYSISKDGSRVADAGAVGGPVVETTWTGAPNQQWHFEPIDDGDWFRIVSVPSGKVIDTVTFSGSGNTYLGLADRDPGASSQRWKLSCVGGGCFQIHNDRGEGWRTMEDKYIVHNDPEMLRSVFRFTEILDQEPASSYDRKVTLYSEPSYAGEHQELPLGVHDPIALGLPMVQSLKVPPGLRVVLGKKDRFTETSRAFSADTASLGDFDGSITYAFVELAASFQKEQDYGGEHVALGTGNYRTSEVESLGLLLSGFLSVRVPAGLEVVLFEEDDFEGNRRVLLSDAAELADFTGKTRSIQIKTIGAIIPESALRYGDKIVLKSFDGTRLHANGVAVVTRDEGHTFTVYRAGGTTTKDYVCYGDTIALHADSGMGVYAWLETNTRLWYAALRDDPPSNSHYYAILRFGGPTQSQTFVAKGDAFLLFSLECRMFMSVDWGHVLHLSQATERETWTLETILRGGDEVRGLAPYDVPAADYFAVRENRGPAIAPDARLELRRANALADANLRSCSADTCGAQHDFTLPCAADHCGAAVCGANLSFAQVCGAATHLVAVCGANVAHLHACGIEQVLAQICGTAACGADACAIAGCAANACGAAACGAAGCSAAGCGAAACGVQACGGDACLADGCGGNGCVLDGCPIAVCGGNGCGADGCVVAHGTCSVDVCGANACVINLCPADACAADACLIDAVPVIPFI